MLMKFYLHIFYLPVLKQVAGQYKMRNDVMFWFSQMIFYKQQEQYVLTTVMDKTLTPSPRVFKLSPSGVSAYVRVYAQNIAFNTNILLGRR